MPDTQHLTLSNELGEVERLTNSLSLFLEKCETSAKDMHALTLALEEWFANIVNHGYEDNNKHLINISIEFEKPILRIRIIDDGIAFNPLKHKLPDLYKPIEKRQIGGIGMHLIIYHIDKISYNRENGTNIVIFEKKLQTTEYIL